MKTTRFFQLCHLCFIGVTPGKPSSQAEAEVRGSDGLEAGEHAFVVVVVVVVQMNGLTFSKLGVLTERLELMDRGNGSYKD